MLNMTSALLKTHHPSGPSPTHLPPPNLSLFSVIKSLLWFVSFSLSLFFPLPMCSSVFFLKLHI